MSEILIAQLTSIGGPVLIALVLVSFAATATALFKVMTLRRLRVGRTAAARAALRQWAAGDALAAQQIALSDRSALGRVTAEAMSAALRWPDDKERAREVAAGLAIGLIEDMGRHVRILETTVQAAPMLGLLGTVLGMIAAFAEMSTGGGSVDTAELAGGIWIALSSTALGLAIAIPFYFLTSWIEGRIERERTAMDAAIVAAIFGPGPEPAALPVPGNAQVLRQQIGRTERPGYTMGVKRI